MERVSGIIVVVTGPSASGKTTTCKRNEELGQWERMITCTTRKRRVDDAPDAYHFLTADEFAEAERKGDLVEKTEYAGNGRDYGILRQDVEAAFERTKPTYVILDYNGLCQMRDICEQRGYHDRVKSIFLYAPADILKLRMEMRGDTAETIIQRLQSVEAELATSVHYDFVIHTETKSLEEVADELGHIMSQIG